MFGQLLTRTNKVTYYSVTIILLIFGVFFFIFLTVRKQFQLKQASFTTLSEMKSTAFLVAFCLLILETQGAKKVAPDHFFKMSAAQVSKLNFLFSSFY